MLPPTEICIVVSADNTYAKHLGALLYSLLSRADCKSKFIIHVFDGGISKSNIQKIKNLVSGFGSTVCFITMGQSIYDNYPVSNHISPSTYYRISIQYLLSHSYSKAIYLDCDMIVKEDISKLWEIDVSNQILFAVEDSGCENNDRLFMPNDALYFNAGVLLINLDNWRKADISGRAHKFIQDYPDRLFLHDQDALNAVFCGSWQQLHPRWNQQTKMFRLHQEETAFSELELPEALHSPAIIHFTEASKPWHYMNQHPYRDEYFQVLQHTEWKYRFPEIQSFFVLIVKPFIGIAYNVLDCLKMCYAGARNVLNRWDNK